MLRGGVFEARCMQGCLRRQLPLLKGGGRLDGNVVVRCVLLPVSWSGMEASPCRGVDVEDGVRGITGIAAILTGVSISILQSLRRGLE